MWSADRGGTFVGMVETSREVSVSQQHDIREGTAVYGEGDRMLGRVERVHGDGFDVAGQHYSRDMVARVTRDGIYVRGAGMAQGATRTGANEGEIRVPVAEERLTVGKREAELGEVEIRKTVTEEEQTVPVTLRRDEVNVREVDVADRPLREGEDAFSEGTIRVEVRGEEAVVAKETVVTGEVVVNKETTTEERQVSGTVRKQHVDVDQAYQEARSGFEQAHTAGRSGRAFEQAEPNYRAGFTAAHDERYSGRDFDEIEPEMRREYETTTSRTGGAMAGGGDTWEQLRQEIRQGWDRARNG